MSLRICTYRLNVNHENGIASRSRLAGCQQVMTKLWRIIQCSIPKSIVKISCVKSKSGPMMNLIYRRFQTKKIYPVLFVLFVNQKMSGFQKINPSTHFSPGKGFQRSGYGTWFMVSNCILYAAYKPV